LSSTNVRDATQRHTTRDANEGDGIRTRNLRIDSPEASSVSGEELQTSKCTSPSPTYIPINAAKNGPDLSAIADALAAVPEADRPAVVAHVAALARLGPAKRTAILTLTDSNEGKNET